MPPNTLLEPIGLRCSSRILLTTGRVKQELGWVRCPASASIVAAGESMIKHGIIVRRDR